MSDDAPVPAGDEILDCGHENAELVIDPFVDEVYQQVVWRRMCELCWQDRKDEV